MACIHELKVANGFTALQGRFLGNAGKIPQCAILVNVPHIDCVACLEFDNCYSHDRLRGFIHSVFTQKFQK